MKRKIIHKMVSVFTLSICMISFVWSVNGMDSQAGERLAEEDWMTEAAVEDVSSDKASDKDTLYAIASVSKMYVTVAAMQLADQGLINIDEPVTAYIPDFEMADARYKDITVRMLMDHTSGLMGSTMENATLYEDNDPSAKRMFLERLKGQRLKADPGAFSTYCNDGFDLLELLVERVSGKDFTDYMTEHIVKPLGGTQTGSCQNAFQNPFQAAVYDGNGQPFVHEYHIGIGAGGVLSTAPELCKFGSAFFAGDNTLLTEKSKSRMAQSEAAGRYEGNYALGWDDVDIYAGQGVKVMGKGGDLYSQHAELMVAPEEKISVAVCSSGGSSTVDELFAKSLMDIVLAERGIRICQEEKQAFEMMDAVPAEFRQYEGLYASGQGIMDISFPDMKYMRTEICDDENKNITCYKYVGNGQFLRMLGDASEGSSMADSDTALYSFEKRANGKVYLACDESTDYAKLGTVKNTCYYVEKLEENQVGDAVKAAWKEKCGKYYYISGKYSGCMFSNPALEVKLSEEADGYVYGFGVHAIKDEDHAAAFVNIPGHMGRDLMDMTYMSVEGKDCIVMDGVGSVYMKEDYMTELTEDLKEVTFSENGAKWFVIDKNMGGSLVSLEKTGKTSVYVYDKADQCTYSTYMSGFDNRIPLPTEGKIVFVGEKGEKVCISQSR